MNHLVTPSTLAKQLGCARLTIYRAVQRGELVPALRIGRRMWFDPKNLKTRGEH